MVSIELAKPTGKYINGHLECVTSDRRTVNAPMILPFGSLSGPTPDWVSQYKNQFFAALQRSGAQYYCVGFIPIWGNLTDKDAFPQVQVIYRNEKFMFLADLDGNSVDLYYRGSNSVEWVRGIGITDSSVFIGSKDNTEPAVLGDTTQKKFEKVYDWIGKLAQDIVTLAAAIPTTPPPDSTQMIVEVPVEKQSLSDIKSEHVKIEP